MSPKNEQIKLLSDAQPANMAAHHIPFSPSQLPPPQFPLVHLVRVASCSFHRICVNVPKRVACRFLNERGVSAPNSFTLVRVSNARINNRSCPGLNRSAHNRAAPTLQAPTKTATSHQAYGLATILDGAHQSPIYF